MVGFYQYGDEPLGFHKSEEILEVTINFSNKDPCVMVLIHY